MAAPRLNPAAGPPAPGGPDLDPGGHRDCLPGALLCPAGITMRTPAPAPPSQPSFRNFPLPSGRMAIPFPLSALHPSRQWVRHCYRRPAEGEPAPAPEAGHLSRDAAVTFRLLARPSLPHGYPVPPQQSGPSSDVEVTTWCPRLPTSPEEKAKCGPRRHCPAALSQPAHLLPLGPHASLHTPRSHRVPTSAPPMPPAGNVLALPSF